METLSPILLFTYKRLDTLQKTIEALKQCYLANKSELIIFSDGYKKEKDKEAILEIRQYLETIKYFKNVKIYYSDKNKGLANSIIEGVTQIFDLYETVIVLEDDLITSKNFIQFMNQCLNYYKNKNSVFSISGYNYPFKTKEKETLDAYLLPRASSWGWATWKNRWQIIDWKITDFGSFSKNKRAINEFNLGGSDLYSMLCKQKKGIIDSWAIIWVYNQFKQKSYTIYPTVSKIQNIGFDTGATHTNVFNRSYSELDNNRKDKFILPDIIKIDPFYYKQLLNYYSIYSRIINRIKTWLSKFELIKKQ